MRAGLLSDPRVVALLRTLFVPVHISALNTPHCMHDRRDVALLASFVDKKTDDFDGGEREAFVLPDGTMQRVFLSLNGHALGDYDSVGTQYTAADRRADSSTRMFRHHGAIALRAVHEELPAAWRELWHVDHPQVAAVAAAAPRWPEPEAGEQGFRVFVRNSYRMYDDLHGCQLALSSESELTAWCGQLAAAGDRAALPREPFLALARAMVPRGMVDTELAPASIAGRLELVATSVDGDRILGDVDGSYSLQPTERGEVGKRLNAAVLFESAGRFVGRFAWDRRTKRFAALRIVTADVQFAWKPRGGGGAEYPPRHQVGIEWVRSGPAVLR